MQEERPKTPNSNQRHNTENIPHPRHEQDNKEHPQLDAIELRHFLILNILLNNRQMHMVWHNLHLYDVDAVFIADFFNHSF